MKSKTINKKQGIGLLYVGLAALVGVIANHMTKSYGWIMIGMAILLWVIGIFLVFKYRE